MYKFECMINRIGVFIRADTILFIIFSLFLFLFPNSTVLDQPLYYKCLSYQSCSLFIDQPFTDLSFQLLILFLSSAQTSIDYNKIYIGQIPLSITEPFIRDAFSKFTEVKDVRIIKGDARGTFDRFCYAFAMIRGNEDLCNQVIKKVNEQHPDWKLNIKVDNDRFKYMQQHQNPPRQNFPQNPYQPPRLGFQQKQHQQPYFQPQTYPQNQSVHQQFQPSGQQYGHQPQQFYNPPPQHHHHHQYQPPTNEPQKIVGEKNHKILVREVWLGGIPQLCDKHYMHQLMSEFGIIQNLEVFPKFAFIKYRMVEHAALAFERAERIYMMFGNPPGFRILFSDPARRANIVGNHYQYDRQSPFLPVLFLGFPPVTSATVDLDIMKGICEKYGTIVNSYMRKNSNNQTRSYFLFTYDNLKSALRAKTELNRRRDLLGDKRVEVTLLLDQQVVLKNRDFSHTEKMFQGDGHTERKKFVRQTGSSEKTYEREPRTFQNYQPTKQLTQPPITNVPLPSYTGIYQQLPPVHYPGYMIPQTTQLPQTYPPTDMFYNPNMYYPYGAKEERSASTDVHELLQSVFQKTSAERQPENPNIEKKPVKTSSNNDQNASDIVSKMLGHDKQSEDHEKEKEREVTWSGFLTWKGLHRVQVDGYAESKELEDYVINISNAIELKDIVRKEKTTMILACGSQIHEPLFSLYLKSLKGKAGVSSTQHSLMYILAKSKESDEIQEIRENQLLVVMERPSLYSLIKDKLQKCEDLK